jgi:hypothetical protein
LWLSHEYPIYVLLLFHSCYMPCPYHPHWLNYRSLFWESDETLKWRNSVELAFLRSRVPTHTQEWLRWREPAAIVNGRPVVSSVRAPHMNKPATVWHYKKIWW